MAIHLNIEDLLSARTVETFRIEYKQGIDNLLNLLLESDFGYAVRDIAGDIDVDIESAESQSIKAFGIIDGDIAGGIACTNICYEC